MENILNITMRNRSAIVKRVNERYASAVHKYGKNNVFVKQMEKRLIATGLTKTIKSTRKVNGRKQTKNIIALKNTKKDWENKSYLLLVQLDRMMTVKERQTYTKQKLEKEKKNIVRHIQDVNISINELEYLKKEYEKEQDKDKKKEIEKDIQELETIINVVENIPLTDSEKEQLQKQYNKLEKTTIEQYAKKEDNLHNLITANASAIYDYNKEMTTILRSSRNLTNLEQIRLEQWIKDLEKNKADIIKKSKTDYKNLNENYKNLGDSTHFG